jgi:hypothetical protein
MEFTCPLLLVEVCAETGLAKYHLSEPHIGLCPNKCHQRQRDNRLR